MAANERFAMKVRFDIRSRITLRQWRASLKYRRDAMPKLDWIALCQGHGGWGRHFKWNKRRSRLNFS